MKLKNKIFKLVIPASLLLIVLFVACKKSFLNKPPLGTLSPEILATEKGVNGLLIGAYSLVDGEGASGDGFASGASNWVYGGVASDDAYKGSDPTDVAVAAPFEQWVSLDANNGAIPQKWSLCYAGAQRCNDVINTLAIATGISAPKATAITAQARFLRAYYHMELKKCFNNIIFADETVNPQNIAVDNSTDVWPKIEADLAFAVANLPATWSEVGRANSWAAKALLAKAYMFQKKYSTAYPILQDIITNGKTTGGIKYKLTDNFFSNFNPAQKNSSESIFAAQTSVHDGSSVDWGGDPNGNYGDILNFPYTGGPGACCGFYNPSQDLANAYKTDANGLPLLDTWFSGNNVGAESGTSYAGNIDPRIDWTMGRPGINYLDWGPHPGFTWIRNPTNNGNKSPKKNVYAASQKGAFTDVGSAYWGPTQLVANNVNIIRFADVILWAAECAADANQLTAARDYDNTVRNRAKNSAWVKTGTGNYDAATASYSSGANADPSYKVEPYTSFADQATAVKAIRFERRLELAMEGNRFFDLVRWDIAAPVINAYIAREKVNRPLKLSANFVAPKNNYFPIPQGEIDNLNADGVIRLKQNTGY